MAKLIYAAITSLDGYIEDESGRFDWAEPDEEVHAFINDLERRIGTYLYGRRMYEVMAGWETDPSFTAGSPVMREFAEMWQAADKVVYSTTLAEVPTRRTRIEREFRVDQVLELKRSAQRDVSVGGPDLAAHAFRAGLVDECHLFLNPIIVGGGKPALARRVRLSLELLDIHRFASGVVHLRHAVAPL